MEIKILSQKLVKPALPTPNHLQKMKISSLDQLAEPIYFPILLHYPNHLHEKEAQILQRFQRLESSLSEILTLYYPLAGRYIQKESMVDCGDQGVEFIKTEIAGELSELIHIAQVDPLVLNRFVKFGFESDTSPLVVVQINMFKCGGLIVGFTMSHRVADGFSLVKFLDAWARASSRGLGEVTAPSFGVGSLFPPIRPSEIELPRPENMPVNCVSRRFTFNSAALSELKARVMTIGVGSSSTSHFDYMPSRVDVVTAVLWKALIAARRATVGYHKQSMVRHAVNMRGKTKLPVPETSFSNFIWQTSARFDPAKDTNVNLAHLVGLIMEAKKSALEHLKNVENEKELLAMVYDGLREIKGDMRKGIVDVFQVTCWCRFPYYEADFGWGKPCWVTSVLPRIEFFVLMDTKSGGVEMWASLDERDVSVFEQDPDIIAYALKA